MQISACIPIKISVTFFIFILNMRIRRLSLALSLQPHYFKTAELISCSCVVTLITWPMWILCKSIKKLPLKQDYEMITLWGESFPENNDVK